MFSISCSFKLDVRFIQCILNWQLAQELNRLGSITCHLVWSNLIFHFWFLLLLLRYKKVPLKTYAILDSTCLFLSSMSSHLLKIRWLNYVLFVTKHEDRRLYASSVLFLIFWILFRKRRNLFDQCHLIYQKRDWRPDNSPNWAKNKNTKITTSIGDESAKINQRVNGTINNKL